MEENSNPHFTLIFFRVMFLQTDYQRRDQYMLSKTYFNMPQES